MGMISLEMPGSGAASVEITAGTASAQVAFCYAPDFLQRLYVIACAVANAMAQEDPATPLHAQRAAYARVVLADPTAVVNRSLVFGVVADGSTGPSSSDQDIANRLGDIWNNFSTGFA